MDIFTELQKIAEYQNALLPLHDRKSEQAIYDLTTSAADVYNNKTYSFDNYSRMQIRKAGKVRTVMMYQPFSAEELLCIYIKRILDRKVHITYPNRNTFMRELFNTTYALKNMSDYTIIRFDFSDFFNSISSSYVYEKYIKDYQIEREQQDLIRDFVGTTKYAYAGLNTSNLICEIIAKHFDELLLQRLSQHGVILYKRYIDDGIIIFNRYVSKTDGLHIINEVITEIFYDSKYNNCPRCKTALNNAKTKYVARRNMIVGGPSESFDFLGYEFVLSLAHDRTVDRTAFQYGITQQKIDKYSNRINSVVKKYSESQNKDIELLRHRIKAYTHRSVYRINRHKNIIWKNKGFLSNYCELQYHMSNLTPQTEAFLKDAVKNAFVINNVDLPYFLKVNDDESIYSLYNNMKRNRTLLFVDMIGIDHAALVKMCQQVGVNNASSKEYDALVREYLIKVKIGH